MGEQVFKKFTMTFEVKDLVHAKIIGEGLKRALFALSGVFDEIHESEVKGEPMTPVAKKFKEAMEDYASVVQEEGEKAAEEAAKKAAENAN